MPFGRRLLALVALALPCASGCISAPTSDCNASASTRPIYVYIEDTPATMQPSAFTVTAVGSEGDTPSITAAGDTSGIVVFSGTGGGDETYRVSVTYERTVIYEGTTSFGVSSCGYAVNVDFASYGADAGDQ